MPLLIPLKQISRLDIQVILSISNWSCRPILFGRFSFCWWLHTIRQTISFTFFLQFYSFTIKKIDSNMVFLSILLSFFLHSSAGSYLSEYPSWSHTSPEEEFKTNRKDCRFEILWKNEDRKKRNTQARTWEGTWDRTWERMQKKPDGQVKSLLRGLSCIKVVSKILI